MIRPALVIATAMLAATVAACGSDPSSGESERATPVRVESVKATPLVAPVRAVGIVTLRDEVRLAFKTGGVIAAIAVEEGDRVHAGQVLAVLEQAEIGAAVEQASEAADKAARDLARGEALYKDEVATLEQLENLRTALAVAKAAERAARFNAQHTRIMAADDGIVLRRLAEPRELVAGGQPVLVVGGVQRGWVVKAALSDRDAVRVQVGDSARVALDAFPGREFEARIVEIASAADPATGTFMVEFAVAAGDARFAQGLIAKVTLAEAAATVVPVVPVNALLEANDGQGSVYVVDAGQHVARRVEVRTGRLVGDAVEIVSGIAVGQQVVTEGAEYLRDGSAVSVLTTG